MQATTLANAPMGSRNSIRDLLEVGVDMLISAGIEEPLREAHLLLAHALRITRLEVIASPDRVLTEDERTRITNLVTRRAERVPLAYLRGVQEFYGLEFEVTPDVLVPRPETELLVDAAQEALQSIDSPFVIDAGTGSGCIAIAIAKTMPSSFVSATDKLERVIEVARRNAEHHGVSDRIEFTLSDFLSSAGACSADLIVSNPPYIPTADLQTLQPEVRDYEPRMALDGGADGLGFYPTLARQASRVLKSGGYIAVEVGAGQAQDVVRIMGDAGLAPTHVLKDLAGIERVVQARKQ